MEHNGLNEKELDILRRNHPEKAFAGVPSLITRSFRYVRWKWDPEWLNWLAFNGLCPAPAASNLSPPYIRATPDVTTCRPAVEDFVIMASSSFWKFMSNEDAVYCVSTWLEWKKSGYHPPATREAPFLKHGADDERIPRHLYVYEDFDNVAVCLIKNALGG